MTASSTTPSSAPGSDTPAVEPWLFAERPADTKALDHATDFAPKFDADGLIPCITVDDASGEVLMFAFMNRLSLGQTLRTGKATYWSRSRGKLWVKGESSGMTQRVVSVRTDCDQDVVMCRVTVDRPPAGGEPAACHVGYASCFFREVDRDALPNTASEGPAGLRVVAERVFDPDKVYGKPGA
ncbi:MAG: phosphoribosyl-AMP cyclohydrolase [Planctomycetota bacterium]